MQSKIIVISGPTASGKSRLAIDLAKRYNGEIINADSMQVYKEIKFLSARPLDTKKIKHHLYGCISVKKNFSTGQWLKLAIEKIKQLQQRKKVPIIVGGTGLYFKSLINGMVLIPKISKTIRNKIIIMHSKLGNSKFYQKLISLDPKSKFHIQPSDTQRMIRAYEVFIVTKKSIYDWQGETKPFFPLESFVKIALRPDRNYLHKQIIKRSKTLINSKSILEVKNFLKLQINKKLPANFIIGVKEIAEYLNKQINKEQLLELIIIRTRQYAKRQFTWQRGQMQDWTHFEEQNYSNLIKKVSLFVSKT